MKILKISRQQLEDLCGYFLPVMIMMIEANVRSHEGIESQLGFRVSLSVMKDIENLLMRKYLGCSNKFKIKFSEAQAIILVQMLIDFPIPSGEFWRINLRNNIVEQLHKQIV